MRNIITNVYNPPIKINHIEKIDRHFLILRLFKFNIYYANIKSYNDNDDFSKIIISKDEINENSFVKWREIGKGYWLVKK